MRQNDVIVIIYLDELFRIDGFVKLFGKAGEVSFFAVRTEIITATL
jgi:hypothetical protein